MQPKTRRKVPTRPSRSILKVNSHLVLGHTSSCNRVTNRERAEGLRGSQGSSISNSSITTSSFLTSSSFFGSLSSSFLSEHTSTHTRTHVHAMQSALPVTVLTYIQTYCSLNQLYLVKVVEVGKRENQWVPVSLIHLLFLFHPLCPAQCHK